MPDRNPAVSDSAQTFLAALPPFVPRWPWIGGDMQTLRNSVRPVDDALAGAQVMVLEAVNGSDRLSGLYTPAAACGRPLVIVIHGLTGDGEGALSLTTASYFSANGWPVLRLTLRGAGANAPFCTTTYHSGLSADIDAVISQLPAAMTADGVVLIGFSAGGNQLLKLLGGKHSRLIRAGAAICAPISLIDAVHRLMAPRNYLYHRHLLRNLKDGVQLCQISAALADGARRARSIYAFDQQVTAPMHGFKDALDFYVQSASLPLLNRIRVPALVIAARDDPWIPASSYDSVDWSACRAVTHLMMASGGHCGFHDAQNPVPWHNRAARSFFEAAIKR